jgi:hypothetical protein
MKGGSLLIDAAAPATLILAAQSVACRAGMTSRIEEVDFTDGIFAAVEIRGKQLFLAAHSKGIELIVGGSRRLLPYFVAPELLSPPLPFAATLRIGIAPGAASIDAIGRLKRMLAMLRTGGRRCTVTAIGSVPAPLLRLLGADESFSDLTPAELVRLMAAIPLFVEPAAGEEVASHEAVLADVAGARLLVPPDSPLLPIGNRLSVLQENSGPDLDLLAGGFVHEDRSGSRMDEAWSRIEPWVIGGGG